MVVTLKTGIQIGDVGMLRKKPRNATVIAQVNLFINL